MDIRTTNELKSMLEDESHEKNHEKIKRILESRNNIDTNEMILDQLILQNRTIKLQGNHIKSINNIIIFYFVITLIGIAISILYLLSL